MKRHNLKEQIDIRRWKKLAGIITESKSSRFITEAKMKAEEIKKGMLVAPKKYYNDKTELDAKTIEVIKIEKDDSKDSGYKVTGTNISDGRVYGIDLNDIWEPKKIGFGRDSNLGEAAEEGSYEEDDTEVNEAALGSDDPIKLSDIDPKLAKAAYKTGKDDKDDEDDVVGGKASGVPVPVGKLKPMQKEVIPDKALAFALGFLHNGTPDLDDMEAIISNDGYIMDGHHRWAARTLINPGASVNVAKVDLPAEELITALNVFTASIPRKGNTGRGDVTKFKAGIESGIIDNVMKGGTKASKDEKGQWPDLSSEEVKAALGKLPGADGDAEKGKAIMIKNAAKLPSKKHPKAPSRVDMPVVDGQEEIDKVVKALKIGQVDIKAPHSEKTKLNLKTKGDEDKEREEEVVEKETEEVSEGRKLTQRFKEFF